ncbi:hypothetical protein [Runella limosa]|jgi:mRNA-degrading endonuclease RelE of RelBE toxin-antitoxin system|uniref:hypothetical protein n=1 Tax=Runella limosa TaxID=370978 RepID=UPI00040934F1|nr:hypothetical protein [Runella limosa]
MNWKIIPLEAFEKEFKYLYKKYPSLVKDIQNLKNKLLESPQQGTPLGKDLYKIRMPISSKKQGKELLERLNTL